MTFATRLRELRRACGLSQKRLAALVGVHHTYLSKCEAGRLEPRLYPSRVLIEKLAAELDADVDELLLLAGKIPDAIRDMVLAEPVAFRRLAAMGKSERCKLLSGAKGGASRPV